ncbi:MAG: GNAT family N-acetyltransferase [Proteobacteria bacterium]|nr:GNAT family N-acetyltransferase [Pseudomonadota bacterium]
MRVYRKLLPAESPLYRDHLLRLDREDRLSRFSGYVSDETIIRHCRQFDWLRGAIIACFDSGVLRGAAELRWEDPRIGWRCEMAVTVERPFQDDGIGTELMRREIIVARNRGQRSMFLLCLTDNRRMQRIVRRFSGMLIFAGSQTEADIAVPFPTQLSLLQESIADGTGLAAMMWDQLAAIGRAWNRHLPRHGAGGAVT